MGQPINLLTMPILPPKDNSQKAVPTSVTLPRWMQEQLDGLAKARGYRSRSEVIVRLLEWGLQELEREAREAALIAAAKQQVPGGQATENATVGHDAVSQSEPPPFHRAATMNDAGGGTWGLRPFEERKKEMRKAHVERALGTEMEASGIGPATENATARQGGVTEAATAVDRARKRKEESKKAKGLQALGHPVADIAKALGLSESRVRELLKDENFNPTR